MGLPDEIVKLPLKHRQEQLAERERAGSLWAGRGSVFASEVGDPLNPRTDARLHDARHTAATVLLLLGVPDRAVMSIMGWSKPDMAVRYQHLTATVRRDVADRLGGLLWRESDRRSEPDPTEQNPN